MFEGGQYMKKNEKYKEKGCYWIEKSFNYANKLIDEIDKEKLKMIKNGSIKMKEIRILSLFKFIFEEMMEIIYQQNDKVRLKEYK